MPDKQQAWDDLHRLTTDKDSLVRSGVASALGSAFSQVPDKQQAWNDLHTLTSDEDKDVRYRARAGKALGSAFFQVPDKQQAWNVLHRLTHDEDSKVRYWAAWAIDSAYSQLPNKQQAWNDLQRLTNDEDSNVRSGAAYILGRVFSQVPDKQLVWNDLHKLTTDKSSEVRSNTACVIGFAFSYIPDKQQAWNDLQRLTSDEDMSVKPYANHSLGKVSIFMTSQAENEEDYKRELENAIEFFERSTQESGWNNPSKFCLPFYRSFHTIIFRKQKAKEEVNRYLEEAKASIGGSESKKQLFEAVKNLAEALKEVQNLGNLDLSGMKDELNFYRKYCDHAAELMKCADEKAPFATEVLRKGLPILDKKLIEEIQERARTAYKEAIGTEVEETARVVCKKVQKWKIGSQEYLEIQIESLVILLKSYVPKIEENNLILNRIDIILQEPDVVKQYISLNNLFPQIMDIQKTSLFLKEIKEIINELQNPQEYLDIIHRDLGKIKDYMPGMKWQIDEVLSKLDMPSSTVTQKLEIAIPIIPTIASYKIEADVPEFVADRKRELNNLVLKFKKK